MRKWTITSLEVLVEKVQKRNLRSFEVLTEQKFGKPNFTSLPIKTERKCGSEASDLAEAEAEFISLAVKAGRKCRSGTSHLRKTWQSRSAERNSCHIMGSQGRAEIRKRNYTSLVVKAV